jgi:hypothetical protein
MSKGIKSKVFLIPLQSIHVNLSTMEKYKIKYILIALVSLAPVIYTYFYDLPGHATELLRGFFLGTLGFSLIILLSKSKDIHKAFLYTCLGCAISLFLRWVPDVYDLLGIGSIELGALGVYLIARLNKNVS